MRFVLPVTDNLDVQHVLSVLAIHSLPNQEKIDAVQARVFRVLRLEESLIGVQLELFPTEVWVQAAISDSQKSALAQIIIHWLALENSTTESYAILASEEIFQPAIEQFPHLRVISYPDLFEAIATTILGQQISVSAARTLARRYVEAVGPLHPSGLRAFPDAQSTARLSAEQLQDIIRCPLSRAQTLSRVAQWYDATGRHLASETDQFLSSFLSLKGVGPWTRDYVALRGLRMPDVFLGTDLVVKRALRSLGGSDTSNISVPASAGALATVLLWAFDSNKK